MQTAADLGRTPFQLYTLRHLFPRMHSLQAEGVVIGWCRSSSQQCYAQQVSTFTGGFEGPWQAKKLTCHDESLVSLCKGSYIVLVLQTTIDDARVMFGKSYPPEDPDS